MICLELTVKIKFYLKTHEKCYLASLFFRTSLMKLYHTSQRMLDSFYHITESNELKCKIRVQNILPCRSALS